MDGGLDWRRLLYPCIDGISVGEFWSHGNIPNLAFVFGSGVFYSGFGVYGAFFLHVDCQKRSGIHREIMPAVVLRGEAATERFILRRVPIPMGFVLLIEDKSSPCVGDREPICGFFEFNDGFITLEGLFERHLVDYTSWSGLNWYQDALGLTRISVSSVSMASFKALPNVRPVDIQEAPVFL